MSPRVREAVLRAGSLLFAALWVWAAATKVLRSEDAYEFTALLTDGDPPAKAVLVAWAAAEAGLGAAMLLGALRGYVPTALLLGAATAALFVVKSRFGGETKCGCLALLQDPSVDAGIVRNAALLVAVLGLAAFARFSASPSGAAGEGPSTAAP